MSYLQKSLEHAQKDMARLQIITVHRLSKNHWTWQKYHQVAKFRAIKQHATGIDHSKKRHDMNLLIS